MTRDAFTRYIEHEFLDHAGTAFILANRTEACSSATPSPVRSNLDGCEE
jgi:hypothetical protein